MIQSNSGRFDVHGLGDHEFVAQPGGERINERFPVETRRGRDAPLQSGVAAATTTGMKTIMTSRIPTWLFRVMICRQFAAALVRRELRRRIYRGDSPIAHGEIG